VCRCDSSVSTAAACRLGGRDSVPGGSKISFFFPLRPYQLLSLIQPPIQWVPAKQGGQGLKLTTHLHLVSRSRMVKIYLHSPIRLDDVVLN
jgi:hypothetical protein